MRKPILAANWKMYKTVDEAKVFLEALQERLPELVNEVDAVLCAPFIHLPLLVELAQGTGLAIGAQNMHFTEEGAFTGEVSPKMLADLGVEYVIIGHSERRQYFNETDESVHLKAKAAHQHGLIPIICVGEQLEEREAGQTKEVVASQVKAALAGLSAAQAAASVLAYEPIWAIGTGRSSSAGDANEVISYIRSLVAEMFNEEVAAQIRLQYGGSVKPTNLQEYLSQSDIDGALIGGASLDQASFLQLLEVKPQ